VKKEFSIFEVEGKRGANLDFYYENFNSIPQNVFFQEVVCGSSLNDESLGILTFLRGGCQVTLFVPYFIYYCFHLNLINGLKSM
jgi:hypothetical protein